MWTYDDQYPLAYPFQEVEEHLFRVIDLTPCRFCDTPTLFLEYSAGFPLPVCSDRCLFRLAGNMLP